MARARIYCEVTCCRCSCLAYTSRYYKNTETISKIKESVKDWIWDENLCGNLCPECQEDLKRLDK